MRVSVANSVAKKNQFYWRSSKAMKISISIILINCFKLLTLLSQVRGTYLHPSF